VTDTDHAATLTALLDRHGRTFSEEIGIALRDDGPDALFQWLVASVLYSARISADLATRATQGLLREGLGTPRAMREAGWETRVRVLNANGYARFDERTAGLLGDVCERMAARWGDDMRRLRAAASGDGARIRALVAEFKGIGPVGAAIFAREAQDPWPELRPFADGLALREAQRLGLPMDAAGLAALVSEADFTRLLAALVRAALEKDEAAILEA